MVWSVRIFFYLCILWVCGTATFGGKTDEGATVLQYNASSDKRDQGNILFFHHMGSMSHLNFIRPLAERLVEVGHNVTLVQYAPSNFHHENFTEILIENKLVESSNVYCIK